MNQILLFLFLNFFLFSCTSKKSDTDQIKLCFDNCQSAIVNMDGQSAITSISEKTIAEYSILLQKIKQTDSSQLCKEEFSTKLFILKVRHLLSPDQIRKLDSKSLLVLAINKGISNNNNIGNSSITKITITDSSAIASLLINKKVSPLIYSFFKEKNLWKMILRTSLHISYKQLFPDTTISENDYINNQLLQISGRAPSNKIWQPIP